MQTIKVRASTCFQVQFFLICVGKPLETFCFENISESHTIKLFTSRKKPSNLSREHSMAYMGNIAERHKNSFRKTKVKSSPSRKSCRPPPPRFVFILHNKFNKSIVNIYCRRCRFTYIKMSNELLANFLKHFCGERGWNKFRRHDTEV